MDFGEDVEFTGAQAEAQVPVPASEPIDLGFAEPEANGGAAEAAPSEPVAADNEDPFGSAFTDGWSEATPAAAPAPAVPSQPEVEDPRLAWGRTNAEKLQKQEKEEAASKAAAAAKAKEHLNKFYSTRTEKLKGMQGTNRAKQTASPEAGVPQTGSTWDKVTKLVNFGTGQHHKDLGRFKATLEACKGRNAAVAAK